MHQRSILIDLLSAVYWFDDAVQENMEARGFPSATRATSFIILNIAQGEHRAVNIAKNLGISRQAVSQMLIALENRGILQIQDDPNDRRSRIVNFAPEFADPGAACTEILTKLEAELGKRIGIENLRALRRALIADWGPLPELKPKEKKASLRRRAMEGNAQVGR